MGLVPTTPAGDRTADRAHDPHHRADHEQNDTEHPQQVNAEHISKNKQYNAENNHDLDVDDLLGKPSSPKETKPAPKKRRVILDDEEDDEPQPPSASQHAPPAPDNAAQPSSATQNAGAIAAECANLMSGPTSDAVHGKLLLKGIREELKARAIADAILSNSQELVSTKLSALKRD